MERNNEEWRPIKGYEGLYEISSYGGFKSLTRIIYRKNGWKYTVKEKITYGNEKQKYSTVDLCKNGICETITIHQLVAEAFIPNPNNLPEINHKDENKHNNSVNNLEWCTSSQNKENGTWKERVLESRKNKNLCNKEKPVLQYTLDGELVKEYKSTAEAERKTGIRQADISRCCNEKEHHKTAGGYIWKFKKMKKS